MDIGAATTALEGAQCNKYTFHYGYNTYMLAHGTGDTITKDGAKNWYIIYPDYAFGQDMTKSFSAAVKGAAWHDRQERPDAVPQRQLLHVPAQGAGAEPQAAGARRHAGRR